MRFYRFIGLLTLLLFGMEVVDTSSVFVRAGFHAHKQIETKLKTQSTQVVPSSIVVSNPELDDDSDYVIHSALPAKLKNDSNYHTFVDRITPHQVSLLQFEFEPRHQPPEFS